MAHGQALRPWKKKGKITPPTWSAGRTQYGLLTIWEIGSDGCYINHQKVGSRTVEDLKSWIKNTILVRIGVKDDAVHKGGFNIFGKKIRRLWSGYYNEYCLFGKSLRQPFCLQ